MLKFYLFFISIFFTVPFFIIGTSSQLNAVCTPSGGGTSISVSGCTWEESQGNLKPNTTSTITFNIANVKGYIPEIEAINVVGKEHKVNITASDFSVGKMYVASGGTLELRNNVKLSFTKEGLQTENVNVYDSVLTISGANSNSKIGNINADGKSSVNVTKEAKLEIGGGKGIANKLNIENGSQVTFDYNEVQAKADDKDVFFEVKSVNLSGKDSTIIKKGVGKVVFGETFYTGAIKVRVEKGTLDIASIGNRSDLPAENFYVQGGTLKFNSGNFKAVVDGNYETDADGKLFCNSASCGEIYHFSKDGDATIEINSGKSPAGKLTAEGKSLKLRNTKLDIFNLKSGIVSFDSNNGSTNHVNKLIIEGGIVNSGIGAVNGTTFSNIEISKNGIFNYATNDFSNLKSLKASDGGVFVFQSYKDLTLDDNRVGGVDSIDFSNNGILRVQSTNSFTLTLQNIAKKIAVLDLQTNRDSNSTLNLRNGVSIGNLILDVNNDKNVFDVQGSSIDQINMKRQGTVNIKNNGYVKDFINSSPFNPKINIEAGGKVDNLSLNQSGDIKIENGAIVGTIDLVGSEKVDINGGNIKDFNVNSKTKKAKLNMVGGKIENFRLNTIIEFTLKDTEITNYEIGIKKETFNFTQEKVENLYLNGKESTVNVGNGSVIPSLKKITLDYGTLVYHYEKNNDQIESLTTTFDHLNPPPPEPCDPDDKECKKEEEDKEKDKITYDSEFRIKAGEATLTVNDVKLENLVIESGNLVVNNSMEIQRRLKLGIDATHRSDPLKSDSNYKVYSNGQVTLDSLLEVEFKSTYGALLNKDNKFNLIYAKGGITIPKDSENPEDPKFFSFLTNLATWFDVDNYITDDKSSYVVNIKRTSLYGDVLKYNGYSGGLADIANILDEMLQEISLFTDDMKEIVSGLDTKSKDPSGLIVNLTKLLPVSNRSYANSIHSNTNKIVDNLSLELRDFTNLENNAWVKMQYNTTLLKDNNDVVGYSEDSNMFQAGYTNIIAPKLIIGGSLSYISGNLNGNNANYTENFNTFNTSIGADYLLSSEYYVKGILSYSITNFDNTRNLSFISYQSNSDLSASEAMAHLEVGYVSILPEKYRDFNANYNVFYSISSLNIDSYTEEGIGKLNVGGASALINDLGIGATFDKQIFYERDDVSLKPTISVSTGLRFYSGVDTNFAFQEIQNKKLMVTDGSYLPLFVKARVGIDYLTDWTNVSVGYRYETDITKYNDSSFYISFKHSF